MPGVEYPAGETSLYSHPPRYGTYQIWLASERYTSYWNVFFFNKLLANMSGADVLFSIGKQDILL